MVRILCNSVTLDSVERCPSAKDGETTECRADFERALFFLVGSSVEGSYVEEVARQLVSQGGYIEKVARRLGGSSVKEAI